MKKVIVYLMVLCMMLAGMACGSKEEPASKDEKVTGENDNNNNN